MPWEAIGYVSSGVTLVAFIAAVAAWVYKSKSEEHARLIQTAEEEKRAELVRDALEFFHIETSGLTREQQYQIALEQIRARSQRFKIAAMVVCFLAVVTATVAAYAITYAVSPPRNGGGKPAQPTELIREGQFRVKQIDEVLESALNKGEECIRQIRANGSVVGACIQDFLTAAQLVTVGMELGGIYRIPGKEDDTVWIASSGYGLRHLPSRQGYKDKKYMGHDLRDITQDYWSLVNQRSRMPVSVNAQVEVALNNLKEKVQFVHSDVLNDWFRRHQAQGEYKAKYSTSYRVFEMQVDDYQDRLNKINRWVLSAQDAWKRFKSLKEIAPFT